MIRWDCLFRSSPDSMFMHFLIKRPSLPIIAFSPSYVSVKTFAIMLLIEVSCTFLEALITLLAPL